MPNEFLISPNEYLNRKIKAFYHTNYIGYRKPGNPDYLNILKNTYNSYSVDLLNNAINKLIDVLRIDLPTIMRKLGEPSITVCVVPRAKSESSYHPNQLLFKKVVQYVCKELSINDGTDYIIRHINTRTTHLPIHTPNYNNDGDSPYPGITMDTCNISSDVRGKDILLIDDIYTKTVNIDEDAIQALLDSGAKSVYFYAIGRTQFNMAQR